MRSVYLVTSPNEKTVVDLLFAFHSYDRLVKSGTIYLLVSIHFA